MTTPKVLEGDVLTSKAQTLVNTVNCVGVMGKGLALAFKRRFPTMYDDYVRRCRAGEVRLGRPYLYRPVVEPWILNFPTKGHWRSVSRLADIVEGLEYLRDHYREWGITSLAVPPLGCGNGQLEWRVVGPTLYRHLASFDIPIELHAPHGTPAEQLDPSFLARSEDTAVTTGAEPLKIQPAWVALVEILARLQKERYSPTVGRTGFQKLAYFATELGLPTGFQHERGSYGPFSAELKRVLTRLVNNGLIREERLGEMFAVRPGPTYSDAARAYQAELSDWEPLIDRVVDLFARMRTRDAEVSATVLFTARELARDGETPTERAIFEGVKTWKQKRRPPLRDEEIADAVRSLNVLGWLEARPSHDLPVGAEFPAEEGELLTA